MDEYGYEECYEPSEFELKINELIKEEVESRIIQTIANLDECKECIQTLQKELRDARFELGKVKRDFEATLKQALKDKQIRALKAEARVKELEAQTEAMKTCFTCKHQHTPNEEYCGVCSEYDKYVLTPRRK